MGSVIKLYVSGNGGVDSASFDIRLPGVLMGIDWSVDGAFDTTLDYLRAQVSFRSASGFTTNDDYGILSEIGQTMVLVTSGVYNSAIQKYVTLPDVPVRPGERLYLHVDATAGLLSNVTALVHISANMEMVQSRLR